MDEKTLQYLGERVDKAREIKKKIEELNDFIQRSGNKNDVELSSSNISGYIVIASRNFERLAARAKASVLNHVVEEIKLLEQELAEL